MEGLAFGWFGWLYGRFFLQGGAEKQYEPIRLAASGNDSKDQHFAIENDTFTSLIYLKDYDVPWQSVGLEGNPLVPVINLVFFPESWTEDTCDILGVHWV